MKWNGRVARNGCFHGKICSFSCTQTCINCQKFQNYWYENCDILKLPNSVASSVVCAEIVVDLQPG
jgi:hypothetical protein